MKYIVALIITLIIIIVPFLDNENNNKNVIDEFNNGTALECSGCAVLCTTIIIDNKTWSYSNNLKKFYNDKGNYFELSDCNK